VQEANKIMIKCAIGDTHISSDKTKVTKNILLSLKFGDPTYENLKF
jgi:hypothetical protein